jgi:hypothetical protein
MNSTDRTSTTSIANVRKTNLHRDEIDAQRAPEGSGARPESGSSSGALIGVRLSEVPIPVGSYTVAMGARTEIDPAGVA